MGTATRIITSTITAALYYFLYIYLPNYLLTFIAAAGTDNGFQLSYATIEIGSFTELVKYITFLGFIIVGLSFAHGMAAKETAVKAIWRLIKAFASIMFWSIFLYLDFNTIVVSVLWNVGTTITMTIDITGLFWVMMGGTIFEFILGVLDLLIAIFPSEKKQDNIISTNNDNQGEVSA